MVKLWYLRLFHHNYYSKLFNIIVFSHVISGSLLFSYPAENTSYVCKGFIHASRCCLKILALLYLEIAVPDIWLLFLPHASRFSAARSTDINASFLVT